MKNNLKLSFYGGAGIGLLFGVIMGTSITPTVATMFGTLTTLLAAILGLNDSHFSNAKAVRVGSFGFACVIGAYMGMFVRTHHILSPSLIVLKEKYIAVGFSEKQALNFIAQKEFGMFIQTTDEIDVPHGSAQEQLSEPSEINIKSTGQGTTHLVMANTHVSRQHSSVLFSAPVELSGCDELEFTDNSLSPDEVLNNFELTGGVWEALAVAVATKIKHGIQHKIEQEIEPEKQKLMLLIIKDAVCKIDKVEEESCKALTPSLVQTNYHSVLAAMINYNKNWRIVASVIDLSTLSEEDKLLSLKLAKHTLCGV